MSKPEPFEVVSSTVSHAIIEMFGGDNNLNDFVMEDLQEMAAGMQGDFSVLALADFANDGATVIEISPSTGPRVLESWGEVDTGEPDILAKFLSRALVTYGSQTRKAIGFWDHGSGVFDEYDPNERSLRRGLRTLPRRRRSRSKPARRLFVPKAKIASNPRLRAMLHDDTNGGVLTNREARKVFQAAFNNAKFNGRVDLIFSDTCLNGMIEVLNQFRDFAEVIVASEELEPGDGWDYFEWFKLMSANPPEDAKTWGLQAIDAFNTGYKERFDQHPCTLGAFFSAENITSEFKNLIDLSRNGTQGFSWLRDARDASQAFANKDTYDLRDFAVKLKNIAADSKVQTSCDKIISVFDEARINSVALGNEVAESYGLAFWFPTSRYAFRQVYETYRGLEFSNATGWADYLGSKFAG